MARNQELVQVPTNAWTQLTSGDATKITWCVATAEDKMAGVFIRVTDNETPPTGDYGLRFSATDEPEIARPVADYRAGGGTPKRVWAKAYKEAVVVLVSDDSV